MNATPPSVPRLRIAYAADAIKALLAEADVLAVIGFGVSVPGQAEDPRWLRVGLEPLAGAPRVEVWRGAGPVVHGQTGRIRWSSDGVFQFGAIEWPEEGDVAAATAAAYAELLRFVGASEAPYLLKIWNYLDAITEGEGDAERYRRFCLGRARVMPDVETAYPAATAIGRRDGQRVLQVYWLAAREAGTPLENPRQLSAWRYPRDYGPQAPQFARAMLATTGAPLALSGTASILGHETRHPGQVEAQLEETLRNLDALIEGAIARSPQLPTQFGAHSLLKVYLRDPAHLPTVEALLDARLLGVPRLILHAEVCRRDLLVEIDGFHG